MFAGLNLKTRLALAFLAAAIAGFALFGDAGDPLPLRSQHYLWDLGHVLIGAGLVLGLHLLHPPLNRLRPLWRIALALAAGLAFGIASEWLQRQIGREASWRDVGLDVTGALLCEWLQLSRQAPRAATRRASAFAAACLALALPLPWLAYHADEQAQRDDFPILADGRQPFEAGRWDRAERLPPPGSDDPALKTCIAPGQFWAGASLRYFPVDWRGYRTLSYRVYLPGGQPLRLVLRIDDLEHKRRGYAYNDRYHASLMLKPGWNAFRLDLDKVLQTPGGRRMDAARIHHLRWFTPLRLARETCVFFDDLRLD
ncbi:MAG: hypothetical protein HYV16_03780 [Gammaproteobacteria bacterium]|nr:hypothetical protein [Gammaproteobacteria bacterium]